MPFADYTNHADCVAKNPDKKDPDAYCATIKRQVEGERLRHPDFKKINTQFLHQIKDECNAITRYYHWVDALNLDETCSYANSMREQFKWVRRHVDFELWKEDSRAKFWMVEAAFPVESMNENLYTLQELQESTRTVKGKEANLNHKFPLPTIGIEAAKYEGGVAECVIRVPKNLICPICDTSKTINDLIEEKGIVNVSLEAVCTLKSDDPRKCEGMEFTGLALLTKGTLPGIPLTRLMPLEHIMVEALQTADETKTNRRKRNVKRIEMKVVEEEEPEPCPEGQKRNADGECVPETAEQADIEDCGEGKVWDPRANDGKGGCVPTGEKSVEQVTTVDITDPTGPGMRDIAPKAVMPDAEGQCPEGYRLNQELGQCVLNEECPEHQHFDQKLQQCVADAVPKLEHPETAVGTAAAPAESSQDDKGGGSDPHDRPYPQVEVEPGKNKDVKVPPIPEPIPDKALATPPEPPFTTSTEVGKELGEPKGEHDCPDGQHYDYDASQCAPDEPITERVKRFEAEDKVVGLRTQVARWQKRYVDVDKQCQQQEGVLRTLKQNIAKLERQIDRYNVAKVTDEVQIRDKTRRIEDLTISRDNYQHQLERLKIQYEKTNRDYQQMMGSSLDLSRQVTDGNEKQIDLATKNRLLEAKLTHMRTLAKKTLKIKV